MERTTFDLLAEPVGKLYHDLLDFAIRECETALLVLHKTASLNEYGKAVMAELERFLMGKELSHTWPGTEGGIEPISEPATVFHYRYGPECADILKQATNRLYGWLWPELPEDLCLLRGDESEWLVTIAHEHDGYLCLSSEEKARLVAVLPQIAPRLQDARHREESMPAVREVMKHLVVWDPYDFYGGDPEYDGGVEAQAIVYALSSGEVSGEAELATYIADMYTRWHPDYEPLAPENCAGIARTIWAWWEKRKRSGHT